jgi:hypothetical protein
VYLGQAAHCSGTGAATETNGCAADSLPLGTPVEVDGATPCGELAYNSWITMQQVGESDEETCAYNDLALIRFDPADVPNVKPVLRRAHWSRQLGRHRVHGLHLRQLLAAGRRHRAQPEAGIVVQNSPGGWSHDVYTLTPGIPG